MAKPKPSYNQCTCCGAETLLVFVLKYEDLVIALCPGCAKSAVKWGLDITNEDFLPQFLAKLTKFSPSKPSEAPPQ